ncbi:uncharacterized protein LOC105430145 isoform X4 [Pogonomyrmex barbatus]|uniref:Uncharacterized protein LOC105430145 isoform X4 n=1 Tax=Pogonomyrmex barbatus TaxID=144034 RepID=A0A6I9WQG5_9HYME|nr:uncharacterized protein LOC105430145 isoform X4 [Pogonomyrmex barbatus]
MCKLYISTFHVIDDWPLIAHLTSDALFQRVCLSTSANPVYDFIEEEAMRNEKMHKYE